MTRTDGEIERLVREVRDLHVKIDRVLELLEKKGTQRPSANKKVAEPLTAPEIKSLQEKFDMLFQRWLGGQDVEVTNELESLDVEELRRFADANNLNVTSKMAKPRVLQLIGARFREKRQLHK